MRTFTYTKPTFIAEVLCLVAQVQLLLPNVTVNKHLIQCQFTLIGLVSTMYINAKAIPINNTDYNCHKTLFNSCRTCITNHLGSISPHIMPPVINSIGGRHTHANTHIYIHTDVRTETILRNQVHAGLQPVCVWFKKAAK